MVGGPPPPFDHYLSYQPEQPKRGWPSWLIVTLVLTPLTLLVIVIGGSGSTERGGMPAVQEDFISIVEKGQDSADENEVAVVQARKVRNTALCELLPTTLEVVDWVGEVDQVSTTLGGDSGVLDIVIAEDINVTTWNNAASDLGDNTLVDPDSDIYSLLGDLDEGDEVTFSGQLVDGGDDCIHEQSLFDDNGMRTPAFVMRFTEVTVD